MKLRIDITRVEIGYLVLTNSMEWVTVIDNNCEGSSQYLVKNSSGEIRYESKLPSIIETNEEDKITTILRQFFKRKDFVLIKKVYDFEIINKIESLEFGKINNIRFINNQVMNIGMIKYIRLSSFDEFTIRSTTNATPGSYKYYDVW